MSARIEPCTADEFWTDDMTESPRMEPLGADLSASEAQEAPEGAGRAAESLARALCVAGDHDPDDLFGIPVMATQWGRMAERILADPGLLLEALAEAGVLREERTREFVRHGGTDHLSSDGWNFDRPHVRYVTDWQKDPR